MVHRAGGLLLALLVLILLGWAAGELWVASIGSAETELMRELAAERSQGLIDFARVVTWLGSLWVLVPLGLVSCGLLVRAGLAADAVALALALLGAVVIYHVTKGLVARPRPPVEHLQKVSGFSFPSGHATQAGAFWLALALCARRIRRQAAVPAAAAAAIVVTTVAFSRVYLGVHYPSDVVAGAALGAAWALVTSRSQAPLPTRSR